MNNITNNIVNKNINNTTKNNWEIVHEDVWEPLSNIIWQHLDTTITFRIVNQISHGCWKYRNKLSIFLYNDLEQYRNNL